MMWSSVDLPAPDGPMIDTNSPGLMSTATRRSTNDWPAPTGNDFSTPFSDISGSLPVGAQADSLTADVDERLKNMGSVPASLGARRHIKGYAGRVSKDFSGLELNLSVAGQGLSRKRTL